MKLEVLQHCELSENTLKLLRKNYIGTVRALCKTGVKKLSKITKLDIRAILRIKMLLKQRYGTQAILPPKIAAIKAIFPTFDSGIENFDELLWQAVDTGEVVLEICGGPGVGKSRLCHTIAFNYCLTQLQSALYIDTKLDFDMDLMHAMLNKALEYRQPSNIQFLMKHFIVHRVYSLRHLHQVLQNLQQELKSQSSTLLGLVVIDSLTALWFLKCEHTATRAYYWLLRIGQLIHQLNREYGVTFIMVNLALKTSQWDSIGFSMKQPIQEFIPRKPAMGHRWLRVPSVRISMEWFNLKNTENQNVRLLKLEKTCYQASNRTCTLHLDDCGVV